MDPDDGSAGPPVRSAGTWDDVLPFAVGSLVLTVAVVVYIPVTGAPWNGVAAAAALFLAVTTLLLLVVTGGYYVLDQL
jgi:hypothetical protein